ncbi:hypothetical protein NM22_07460 [Vibrio tubiashii]|nr:hypothetical protein NM22_07460 [Vibrio tubiashii]
MAAFLLGCLIFNNLTVMVSKVRLWSLVRYGAKHATKLIFIGGVGTNSVIFIGAILPNTDTFFVYQK